MESVDEHNHSELGMEGCRTRPEQQRNRYKESKEQQPSARTKRTMKDKSTDWYQRQREANWWMWDNNGLKSHCEAKGEETGDYDACLGSRRPRFLKRA